MEKINIDIRFEGKNFSPRTLKDLTKLPIEVIMESGEIATIGRYKNKRSPYGLALLNIKPDPKKNLNDLLDDYLSKLVNRKKEIEQSGVEEIVIDVETPILKDSEFSLEKNLWNKLSALNARVDVHFVSASSRISDAA